MKCDICKQNDVSKDDPAKIILDGSSHEFIICDECALLLDTIQKKVGEYEQSI